MQFSVSQIRLLSFVRSLSFCFFPTAESFVLSGCVDLVQSVAACLIGIEAENYGLEIDGAFLLVCGIRGREFGLK